MIHDLCIIYDGNLEVGENPIYHPEDDRLFFIDIRGMSYFSVSPRAHDLVKTDLSTQIGCLAFCENGDLLLGLENGVYRTSKGGNLSLIHERIKIKGRRFNDGKIGPDGAFYLGTTSDDGNGAFYRVRDGHIEELFDSVSCSNGIDFTSDGQTMYYIDSPNQTVEAFDFDIEKGKIYNRRSFFNVPREWGLPDGMTLDENDNLWVALWGGHRVIQIDKDKKEIINEILLPCPKVSSCAFGGTDLSELYITTAAMSDTKEYPKAGNVFKVLPGVKGKKMNYYKW